MALHSSIGHPAQLTPKIAPPLGQKKGSALATGESSKQFFSCFVCFSRSHAPRGNAYFRSYPMPLSQGMAVGATLVVAQVLPRPCVTTCPAEGSH